MSDDDPALRTDELLREYLHERDASCPDCGYSLRGLTTGICPECSRHIELNIGERERSIAGYVATICPICGFICIGIVALMGWWGGDLRDDSAALVLVATVDLFLLFGLVSWAPRFFRLRWWHQLACAGVSWLLHIAVLAAVGIMH